MARQSFPGTWTVPVAMLLVSRAVAGQTGYGQKEIDFFEEQVRPILIENCYACHSAETKPAGGLRVGDRNGLLTGGMSGPAVVPGEAAKSLLLKRVAHADKGRRVPKEGQALTAGANR
jgi:hypothetical protein